MTNGLTRGQAFLVSKEAELDTQTQFDIRAKKLQFMDGDIYHRREVTGNAGIVVLLDETNIRKAGTTSWNGNKLAKGFNMVLEKIRLGVANHATEVNPAKVTYTNKLTTADIALQNAEFRIKQDGKVIVNVPVARMLAEQVSASVQGKEDAYTLDSLRLLTENTPISIELEYPVGSTVDDAAKHHLEIRFMGAATAPR